MGKTILMADLTNHTVALKGLISSHYKQNEHYYGHISPLKHYFS